MDAERNGLDVLIADEAQRLSERSLPQSCGDRVDPTTIGGTVPISRTQLAEDFVGVGRRTLWCTEDPGPRPQRCPSAMAIMRAAHRWDRPRPDGDDERPDGSQRHMQ